MISLSSTVEPTRVRPIVCDWDASSRKPGTGHNAHVWRELLPEVPGLAAPVVVNRRLGELVPVALTAVVSAALADGERPLVLGGDHRLSFSVLRAVCGYYDRPLVHHFDAHHDAHPSPSISNFSVFDHAARRLGVPVTRYGCREANPPLPPSPVGPVSSAYISIDLDYLDPKLFGGVSFPEPVPDGLVVTPESLCDNISRIGDEFPVIGADLVEWRADAENPTEVAIVIEVLKGLSKVLSASTRVEPAP
ncbi:arginase family protein [Stackebrandtia soli]|uniref:arginase family protein n=1 Tax=Stackebrandtia soli TaxID=1892856 RepID=UPI0039E7C816